MGKKTSDAGADASEFRAAVRDVKPLPQPPPVAGLAAPKPHPRPRKPPRSAAENLDELMPLVATPALNLVTQSIEHEADRFGLEMTQNNDAAAAHTKSTLITIRAKPLFIVTLRVDDERK